MGEAPNAATLPGLVRRAHDLVAGGRRGLLGIVGPPGAGKSSFAHALVQRLRGRPPAGSGSDWVVQVPMDGYHLADSELVRLGRLERKGAPDTFDAAGYAALLTRLAGDGDEVVYAPAFDRDLEQPVAGSIAIAPGARLIVTEGNYLLLEDGAWAKVRGHLSEVWYIELDDQERLRRLIARHQQFGKSELAASEWAHGIDQRNADVVVGTCTRADLRVSSDVLAHTSRPDGVP